MADPNTWAGGPEAYERAYRDFCAKFSADVDTLRAAVRTDGSGPVFRTAPGTLDVSGAPTSRTDGDEEHEREDGAPKPYRLPSLADKWRAGPQGERAPRARADGLVPLSERWRR